MLKFTVITNPASFQVTGEFEWSKAVQGQILGAFFWGYLGSQVSIWFFALPLIFIARKLTWFKVLGGYLATRFGGKRVILVTILGSSLLTLASPVAARTHAYLLAALRVAIGFLQAGLFTSFPFSVWWTLDGGMVFRAQHFLPCTLCGPFGVLL